MERYAPTIKDLAARDVVSRAILTEVREGRGIHGRDYVHLDLTHLGERLIQDKLWEISSFARIYLGIDPVRQPIPVSPTCHYAMGGIPTDVDGRVAGDETGTTIQGLYSAGECACVSVHGANRLGCNSLLDLLVFGRRSGMAMREDIQPVEWPPVSDDPLNRASEGIKALLEGRRKEKSEILRREMQRLMMHHGSVFREEKGLKEGIEKIRILRERYQNAGVHHQGKTFNYELVETIELGHQLDLAEVILLSALHRRESRGGHFREDYPQRDDQHHLKHTFVLKTAKGLEIREKPVRITRFQPQVRVY